MAQKLQMNRDNECIWDEMCDNLFDYMPGYRGYESLIRNNKVAQLVGHLPYLAKTERPYRDAMSNLTIFILSSYGSTKEIYTHCPDDDCNVYSRLRPIMNFTGGQDAIIDRGMALIAMVLLNDYKRDMSDDLITGHYNPLNAGVWDYDSMQAELTDRIKEKPCRKMDRILSLNMLPFVVWNP